MTTSGMAYVGDSSSELAKEFEERVSSLPKEIGVIFVGAQAVPVPGGESTTFNLTVGVDRRLEEQTIEVFIRRVFEKEMSDGKLVLTARIIRGTRGAASDQAFQRPPTVPS